MSELDIFNQPYDNLWTSPLREAGAIGLFAPVEGVHLREKVVVVFRGPLILVMHVTRLHINLDQLINKATPKFTSMATLELSFFLSFFLLISSVAIY